MLRLNRCAYSRILRSNLVRKTFLLTDFGSSINCLLSREAFCTHFDHITHPLGVQIPVIRTPVVEITSLRFEASCR